MRRVTTSRYPELNPKGSAIIITSDLTDMNVLYEAFLASMKSSAWKEEPQRIEINMLSELCRLKRELATKTYRTSQGVEFTLSERGKTRHITGGRMRDRIVRHALCDTVLAPAIKPYLIYNNGASQKGKGLTFVRKMFERDLHNFWLHYRTNDGYIGFVDISKFYDNIPHAKTKELLYPLIDADSRCLMDEVLSGFEVDVSFMEPEQYALCMAAKFDSVWYYANIPEELRTGELWMQKSVNIGDQVSQEIGVFYPTRIDNYVKIVCGCKWYGRYMDDMYIICKDKAELQSIISGIEEQAKALGLFINSKKTRVCKLSDTYKFLQIKYSLTKTGKVVKRLDPATITRERRRLKAYKRLLDVCRMTYGDIEQSTRSWMGNFAKLMSKKQREHIKSLYFELFRKEITWRQQSRGKTVQR